MNWRLSEAGIRVEGADRRDESISRWRTAKAAIVEIELARLDGSMIPLDVASRAIGALLNDARYIWQGLPTTLSLLISESDQKALIKSEGASIIKSGLNALERAAREINKTARKESQEWDPTPK